MAVDEARVWTFGAAGLAAAAGLASFFASFTGPDGPAADTCQQRVHHPTGLICNAS
jgi:hypothetical protein